MTSGRNLTSANITVPTLPLVIRMLMCDLFAVTNLLVIIFGIQHLEKTSNRRLEKYKRAHTTYKFLPHYLGK